MSTLDHKRWSSGKTKIADGIPHLSPKPEIISGLLQSCEARLACARR